MSGDARSPWTERERDALNTALRDSDTRIRALEIEGAVLKTKIAIFGTLWGIAGTLVAEVVKLLMRHQ